MWAVFGALGALTVLTGALPGPEAREVALTRGGPIMGS